MPNVLALIAAKAAQAIEDAFGAEAAGASPAVAPAADPRFGHYQCNAAMGLSKALKRKPRDIAQAIVERMDLGAIAEPPEIAGPGFINISLKPEFAAEAARRHFADEHLGVERPARPLRVIVDYPSPNLAKEMHVGHLRVAIIGDCIARVHEFLGHTVLRRDHIGDWGTQYGMLVAHLKEAWPEALAEGSAPDLGDINEFYKRAKARFDEDEEFKQRSYAEVVKLQSGDPEAVRGWKTLCDHSRRHNRVIYSLLGVESEEKGESFYKPYIPPTLEELERKGMIVESQGARCIFLEGFKNKDGDPLPLIVQKSDGGYNYDTTDMAAIRYRVFEEKAGKIVYVTDAGQSQHFAMIFAAAQKAGWLEGVEAVHVPFGMVLGEDRKKFKTRSGETVRLRALLDEAVLRARAIVEEKNPEMDEATKARVAQAIGVGAVKYADLSQNRMSDYVFSYDKMLALSGNTAPYLIYAYVRVQSIARKGGIDWESVDGSAIDSLATPEEFDLARALIRLPETLALVEADLAPNRLTDYLYDLSQVFSRFYTNNIVLGDPRERARLALCKMTARTLKTGLGLLGIEAIEAM